MQARLRQRRSESANTGPGQIEDVKPEAVAHDAVFGTITNKGPNYRNVGWLGTAGLMMKSQIGLGVLSIPSGFHTLGLIPGIICLLAIAAITTWSGLVIGDFKLNHPETYGIDDAAFIMFGGRIAREISAVMFALFLVFTAASGILSISIALNAVSHHGVCTAVFVIIGTITVMACSSIQTLGRVSWLAWVGVFSIMTAIVTITIAESDYQLFGQPTFEQAISTIATFIFAYAGNPFFFAIASEMRDFRHYHKAIGLCQIVVTIVYIVIGAVVYCHCGSHVASPALASAGQVMKMVAYGIALPGLIVGPTLSIHISIQAFMSTETPTQEALGLTKTQIGSKHFFIRMLRGSHHLTSNTCVHWTVWLGCITGCSLIAYVIASGIPMFDPLLSLIGAFFGTFQCFQPMGCMWLYDNWRKPRTWRWLLMVTWAIFVILSGWFLMIGGTYGSVVEINHALKRNGTSGPWSCADNSNSMLAE